MSKTTPSNCKLTNCPWNKLPPPENSQDCIGCARNKDPHWTPLRKGEQP